MSTKYFAVTRCDHSLLLLSVLLLCEENCTEHLFDKFMFVNLKVACCPLLPVISYWKL